MHGAINCDILCDHMHRPLDTRMLRTIALFLLLGLLFATQAPAADAREVVVTGPYLDLHTGPGRGYPVAQSVPRGARVVLLFQRTDWVKVRIAGGYEGWVHRVQLQQTRAADASAAVTERTGRRDRALPAGMDFGQEIDAWLADFPYCS